MNYPREFARSKPIPTKKSHECPVCDDTSGKCRTFEDKPLVLCMVADFAPGWKDLGFDRSGLWRQFLPANTNDSTFDRAEWQRRKREEKPLPQVMTLEERDRFLRDWLAKASLRDTDRADLERRGIKDFSIALSGKPGYGVPFKGLHGHYVGMQWKAKDPSIAGKYPWYNLPKGKHYPGTRELPIAVVRVDSPKGLVLVEGTGVKPILAAERLGMIAIGASGGNHIASLTQLKEVFGAFPDLPVTISPDAGDLINPHVMRRLDQTVAVLRQLEIDPKFLYWGQQTKTENDIDEASQSEIEAAQLLTWEEFEALSKQDQQIEYPSCDIAEQIERDRCEAAEAKERAQTDAERCIERFRAETERIQAELNGFSATVTTATNSDKYIPKNSIALPEDGGVITLDAPMGSGKSANWLKDLVKQHRQKYPKSKRISIVPRKILGKHLGETLDLGENTHCFESYFKIDINDLGDRSMLVCDEASQTFKQLLDGATYGNNHAIALDAMRRLLQEVHRRNGWIVLSEDGLTNCELKLIEEAAPGIKVVLAAKHEWNQLEKPRRTVTIYSPKKGSPSAPIWARIIRLLEAGENVVICSDSQRWLRKTERMLMERGYLSRDDEPKNDEDDEDECYPGRQIWIIDSKSSHKKWVKNFIDDREGFIARHQPRVLAYSPVLCSGVDIRDDAGHFAEMAFYFSHLPPRDAKQIPERIRTDISRFGYVKERAIVPDEALSGCRPEAIVKNYFRNKDGMKKLLNFAEHIQKSETIVNRHGDETTIPAVLSRMEDEINIPGSDYSFWFQQKARYEAQANYGKLHLREELIKGWESRGYEVTIDDCEADREFSEDVGRISEALDIEEAFKRAAINKYVVRLSALGEEVDLEQIADESGLKEALKVARQVLNMDAGSNPIDRRIARRFIDKHKLPTCNLDDPEFVHKVLVKQRGKFLKSAELLWLSQNQDAAKQMDLWSWDGAFRSAAKNDSMVWLPKLSNRAAQAKLIAECPIQSIINGTITHWHRDSSEAIAIHQWAVFHKYQLKRHLRLDIREEHSPVKTVNKLLKKLGFETKTKAIGGRENRSRIYWVSNFEDVDRDEIMKSLTMRYLQDLADKEAEAAAKVARESDITDTIQIVRDCIKGGAIEEAFGIWKELSQRDRNEAWCRLSAQEQAILNRTRRDAA